jgi:tRNA (cytidine/uridine-2'-O-)-methyltransferase
MIAIALYQPDIPQNCGAILRLAACLGVTTHIIGPVGFELSDRTLRRAGMDYLDHAACVRHIGWKSFDDWRATCPGHRLVLATTAASLPYTDFPFGEYDVILFGRESAGVPHEVHAVADARILIPMVAGLRSLNVATSAAMILGEALRQTHTFPVAAQPAEARS